MIIRPGTFLTGSINWYGSTVRASVFTAPELANLEIYYKAKAGL